MDNTERKNIRLVVEDEKHLYSAFSPEAEFSEPVKAYIRSKLSGEGHQRNVDITVMAREQLDEERFRTAVSNWIKAEWAVFRKKEKETVIKLVGSLVFGSILIILSIAGQKQYEVMRYSLLPIMGSLALGTAARILIMEMPAIRIERWFFKEVAENSVITFEYTQHQYT